MPPSPEGTGVYITRNTTYRPGYTQAYCKGTPLDADARNAQGRNILSNRCARRRSEKAIDWWLMGLSVRGRRDELGDYGDLRRLSSCNLRNGCTSTDGVGDEIEKTANRHCFLGSAGNSTEGDEKLQTDCNDLGSTGAPFDLWNLQWRP